MVVLRIVLVVVVVLVGALIGAWTFSRDRRYLHWAWLVVKLAVIAVGIFLVLLALEAVLRVV